MRFLFRAAALACVLAAPAQAKNCVLPRIASLELTPLGDGEYVVPVTIAGAPRDFILGLDLPFSAISGAFADAQGYKNVRLSNRLEPIVYQEHVKRRTTVADMSIGASHGEDVSLLRKDEPLPGPGTGAVGILGLDLLRNFDVELDLKNRRLTLFSPNDCDGNVVYWTKGDFAKVALDDDPSGHVSFPMTLDGKEIDVDFDIGGDAARMGTGALRRVFDLTPQSPGVTGGMQDGVAIYRYPFKTLAVKGVEIHNPRIAIVPDEGAECRPVARFEIRGREKLCFGVATLRLKGSVLSALHLYIAFKEKTVYVTAAEAH